MYLASKLAIEHSVRLTQSELSTRISYLMALLAIWSNLFAHIAHFLFDNVIHVILSGPDEPDERIFFRKNIIH